MEPGPEGITVTTQWMEDKPSVTVYRLDPAGKRLFGLAPGKALQPDFDAIAARHLQPDASGNTWFTYATRTEQGGSAR